jgi:curved DNA-binding protein
LYPWQAVLGTKTTIPTLDGPAALRIPPGTTAGQQLRLQGKGLPRRDGGHGDLYAVVSIQIPSRVSSEERRLWEQLARQADLNSKSKS